MKKMKALLGLMMGLAMGIVIGFVAADKTEINADEFAIQEQQATQKGMDETTNKTTNKTEVPFKLEQLNALNKTVELKQDETTQKNTQATEYLLLKAPFKAPQNNNQKAVMTGEEDEANTEEIDEMFDFENFTVTRTEGDLIGTILAFEIYEEEGATDVLVEFENGEKFSFTDWYSPKLVVGEKRLIHFISFDYGNDGIETYYYILKNEEMENDAYNYTQTMHSSAVIQSIESIQGSELNEKRFTLKLADGTEALATFFASEEDFVKLGLVKGNAVNVIIDNYYNEMGDLVKKETYFDLVVEEEVLDTTNTSTEELITDTTNTTTGEATTDTTNTSTEELITDTTNATTGEVTTDTTDTTNTTTGELNEESIKTLTDELIVDTTTEEALTDEAVTETVNTNP